MNVQTPLQNTKPAAGNGLPAETAIRTAGPGGSSFFDISWLAVEEVNQQGCGTEAPQHGPRLTYLPNLQAALKSHMHSSHRLDYANSKTRYFSYYQSASTRPQRYMQRFLKHVQSFPPNETQRLSLPHRPSLSKTRCLL